MMLRYASALLAALLLGVCAAGLVACGSTKKLIPAGDASALDSALARVSDATNAGDCTAANTALADAQKAFAALPASVSTALRARINDGLAKLSDTVPTQCLTRPHHDATPTTPSTSTSTSTSTPSTTTTTTTTTTPTTDHDDAHDHHDDAHDHAHHDAAPQRRRGARRRPGARRNRMSAQLLANRYSLGERLGSGGMSTVVLAMDERLERHVAVKLLAEHLADDRQFVARFRREALSVARLVHPNIVQVFDFGLDESSGRQYIVMEYVQGQSGAEILRERGMLPVGEALGIISQACRGLDYAHRSGVVHRDVKPGNLLRSDDGVVKLADFGIAKAISEESSITAVGSVLGTAAYLAPEQATGQTATSRSDIYGLGVVTYQFLSGRLPYEAQSLTELALKQQREAPPLLDQLNPEVSAELAAAVDRALALEPEDRYATAEEFRQALSDGARGIAPETSATRITPPPSDRTSVAPAAVGGRRAGDAGPAAPAAPAGDAAQPADVPIAPAPPPARRRRGLAPLIVVILALAAGVATFVVADKSTQHGAPAPGRLQGRRPHRVRAAAADPPEHALSAPVPTRSSRRRRRAP